jgi:hypothetical protein
MGLQTKGFYLVPFLGGVALVADRYKTYGQQAFVVLAGPVGGGLLALVTAGTYYITGIPFLAAAAAWMCYLNIFNLFPLSFLDGGQLMTTITYSLNRTVGVVLYTLSSVIATFILWRFNPALSIMVGVLGGMSVASEIRNLMAWRRGDTWLCSDSWLNPPKALTKKQMLLTVLGWAATAVLLGFAMHILKTHPEADLSTILPRKN